ncbi:4Fe-4S ferredoxin N-terminal domain-containing protein [Natronococcus sp. A-GB1]|uniref:4Fe-4S ferredoxin N-terminal domain-containing protein n=1 Tax=Natronococcus sp. A-GB1 TaxID=3037648 RepID=UPI00241C4A14|nr:4Fe-4S ferredoxin N-terminal domain-containing protein [Natronococcus sp. A-GB1]MDG5759425.1 4Fe-4S ferredoxin N-terminal domain-containing protein [Natronococcus sp. A-GB1]
MSADDESFHPLGEEWENDLEGMLDDTEYDTDLGMAMAEDAMRVTRGELSEADFHEKYHDDVLEEFGEDNRPTQEAYEKAQEEAKGTVGRMLSRFDGDGEEPRRDVMKKMGAGAAAVGLGAWATVDDGEQQAAAAQDDEDESGAPEGGEGDFQWGMAIDLERCDGCLSCVTACSSENNLDQGVNWMYVLEFEDPGASSTTSRNRMVRPCQHCTDAPCEKVCPTTARHTRDSDGLVLTDYDVCIGCRYCQVACPYGVNYFQWDEPDISTDEIAEFHEDHEGDHMTTDDGYGSERWVDSRAPRGVMSKCTMCPTRQDGQMGDEMIGTTACQEACPPDAIQFGNMHDETSDPQTYAANPARGRTLAQINPPSADELEEDLEGADDDLESVLEAAELDEEELALMIAVQITGGDEMGEGDGNVAELENDVTEALAAIEDHGLGLASQEVLAELDLADEPDLEEPADGDEEGVDVDDEDDEEENGDDDEDEDDDNGFEPDEEAAQFLLEQFAGTPASNFKLLEEQGTNPNIIYLGNEPGPQAEQIEPTGTGVNYEDISYERADGESVEAVDNRKDVLDEGTVGDAGVSL